MNGALGAAGHNLEDRGRAVESILLNHYFGCFHDGEDSVTLLEFQFVGTAACDGTLDEVVPNTHDDMRHDITQLHFFDGPTELVSG